MAAGGCEIVEGGWATGLVGCEMTLGGGMMGSRSSHMGQRLENRSGKLESIDGGCKMVLGGWRYGLIGWKIVFGGWKMDLLAGSVHFS